MKREMSAFEAKADIALAIPEFRLLWLCENSKIETRRRMIFFSSITKLNPLASNFDRMEIGIHPQAPQRLH
jgi:hypothetical protein